MVCPLCSGDHDLGQCDRWQIGGGLAAPPPRPQPPPVPEPEPDYPDFDGLFLAARPRVLAMLVRYVGEVSAEDVMQEAALAAWKNFGKWQQTSTFGTWLYAIARREAFRHRVDLPVAFDPERCEAPLADCPVAQAELHAAIAALAEHYRGPLVLADLLGFSYEEVAETLHLELGTVRSRLLRARRTLKEVLG